jgi:hypothetical protein
MSNQYKDRVAYDLSEPVHQMMMAVNDVKSVSEHATILSMKGMPSMLLLNTSSDSNFRDAILHQVIDAGPNVLEVFIQAVKSSPNDTESLTYWCEYAAALAYAQGEPDLAKAIVLRLPPTTSSSLIKNIAVGLSNGMEPSSFKELLRNSTAMSASLLA